MSQPRYPASLLRRIPVLPGPSQVPLRLIPALPDSSRAPLRPIPVLVLLLLVLLLPFAGSKVLASDPKGTSPASEAKGKPLPTDPRGTSPATDAKGKAVEWSYEGAGGPERWALLAPGNFKCAQGTRQSPVNIVESEVIVSELEPVQFNYQPSSFRFEHNGHTLQATLEGDNHVIIRGVRYDLVHIQFHAPSEMRINHRNTAMDAHLVHRSREGRLAVVGVLLDAGGTNPVMDLLWSHLPLEKGEVLSPKSARLDLAQLLPPERGYFQFMGSLTTPPCTEGVLWTVIQQPVRIRADQASIFLRLVGMNARPVQPLNQRPVRFSR